MKKNNVTGLGNMKVDISRSNKFLGDIKQMGLDRWSNQIELVTAANANEREW